MPHFPSLFVGTVFSGCAFLAIHQQLSHRRRLSEQWALQEYATQQVKDWYSGASRTAFDATKQLHGGESLPTIWNKGVRYVQDALNRKD